MTPSGAPSTGRYAQSRSYVARFPSGKSSTKRRHGYKSEGETGVGVRNWPVNLERIGCRSFIALAFVCTLTFLGERPHATAASSGWCQLSLSLEGESGEDMNRWVPFPVLPSSERHPTTRHQVYPSDFYRWRTRATCVFALPALHSIYPPPHLCVGLLGRDHIYVGWLLSSSLRSSLLLLIAPPPPRHSDAKLNAPGPRIDGPVLTSRHHPQSSAGCVTGVATPEPQQQRRQQQHLDS